MGGSHSTPTRKLSIPNEESNVIKISESVVERLKKCTEQSPPEEAVKTPPLTRGQEPPLIDPASVRNKENMPYYPGDPLMNFYYGPSVTSLRILQAKEKELKQSEEYWTERIRNMEKHHLTLSEIQETAYNKAIGEISSQAPRPPPNTPFPCCEQKQKLIECYRKNPNEVLLCAGEVTEFADCVHSKRIEKSVNTQEKEKCEDEPDKKNKKKK